MSQEPSHEPELDAADAAAALRWWRLAGVEFAVDETPHNRFEPPAAIAPHEERVRVPPPSAPAPAAPWIATSAVGSDAEAAASELAAASADLETLRLNMEKFEGCALKRTATQLVFADGVPGSRVMFVGEAPGADEDRIGRPFVGRAGQLLDRMLRAIGLDRKTVYIANVVPWRPPGNRTPTPQETAACLPFIRRQIELAAPKILVCMGASSAQTLLGMKEGITRARGKWFAYRFDDGRELRALAMFHPAYLLRQPSQKRAAWTDLRALAKELGS
ncbi:MAG TPA: uracil-DNA glycosylase [Roseiarcus sp.]|nr:uracil-DNA glycosylase [Roseiarcus sp.]